MSTGKIDPEETILEFLRGNDERAMVMLFDRYAAHLISKVTRIVRQEEAAKDIVQEIFVNVWVNRHSRTFHSPIAKYLERAALNRALNYVRDNARFLKLNQPDADAWRFENADRYPADQLLEAHELSQAIHEAINRLPDKLRLPFILSRDEGMTHKMIAEELKITEVVVEKSMIKALKLLRKFLAVYLKVLL